MKKEKVNYVDKKELYDAIIEYHETGAVSDELHVMFYTMAEHISRKSMFIGYTYRDDMVVDGYLRCVKYVGSFDINKTNPFAYFQTCIENEFWKFRNKEKTYQERKWKELSDLITNTENEYHITLVMPEDIKLKMYAATATMATLESEELDNDFEEFVEEEIEDGTEEN